MGIEKFFPFMKELPSGWSIVKFNEILAENVRNGIYKSKEFHGRGQKLINMGEIFAYDFISSQNMRRLELSKEERINFLVHDGDLLFARRSLILEGSGKCSLVVDPPEETSFESSIIRAKPDHRKADSKFLFYFFISPLGRTSVISIATRTAVSGIRGSDLVQLQIPLPPLPTQRKIAAILSAYDDLIENNTRRIKILEEMAQAIYREWFVHFRFPGYEGVKMVDTELGLVPEGWEIVSYTDAIDVMSGGTPRTSFPEYWDGDIPWFTPQDIKKFPFILKTDRTITHLGLNKCNSKLYPENTVFITARGTVGKCILAAVPMAMSQTNYALIGRGGLSQYWVYLLTQNLARVFQKKATGAVFDTIVVDTFRQQMILLPPKFIMEQFDSTVVPIFAMIKNLQLKNESLHSSRDLLLPKLVSGELDVSEIDIAVSEHNQVRL
jgi:type I restriction enzyme, S subunit